MENINKLGYTQYKINEKTLFIPMENIIQEYDDKKFTKNPYLFKLLYIGKYIKKENKYIVYLGPLESSNLPIIKATIPIEIFRINKIIPSYNYDRPLEDNEQFILCERTFRKINEINKKCFYNKSNWYMLCYGYLINRYKDDDALTKIKDGIQEFNLISNCPKKIKDRNFETTCYISNNLTKILSIGKLPNIDKLKKFKCLPSHFFIDKKHNI